MVRHFCFYIPTNNSWGVNSENVITGAQYMNKIWKYMNKIWRYTNKPSKTDEWMLLWTLITRSTYAPSSHLPWHVAEGILLQASVLKSHLDDTFIGLGGKTPEGSEIWVCEESQVWCFDWRYVRTKRKEATEVGKMPLLYADLQHWLLPVFCTDSCSPASICGWTLCSSWWWIESFHNM